MTFPSPVFMPMLAAGGGDFPVVEDIASGTLPFASQSTSHSITLPSGVQAGDILVIFFTTNGVTHTPPAGWTQLLTEIGGTSNAIRHSVFTRTADGSEGSGVTITTSANTGHVYVAYRVSGGASVEGQITSVGSNLNPDPPSLSPAWGEAKTLWIAAMGARSQGFGAGSLAITGFPSGYSDQLGPSAGLWVTGAAWRDSEAGTENPGTFTINSDGQSRFWIAVTIAIEPK